jgi:DNA topoisomerase IA
MIGFKVSPLLWKRIYMSRERVERGAVPPRAETHTTTTSSRLTRADAGLQDRRGVFSYKLGFEFHEFSDRAEAVAFLEASKRHEHLLSVGEKRTTRKQPPKPLNTSPPPSVQQHARVFPKLTMSIAQQLYQAG